eukprot:c20961_g1_i2.p1 GENE.c20961_g1_i2~~c20961_g1_i2.p1  ORF type:complete len:255 (+),score=123.97 c20961_g1_i2:776-1540(+)
MTDFRRVDSSSKQIMLKEFIIDPTVMIISYDGVEVEGSGIGNLGSTVLFVLSRVHNLTVNIEGIAIQGELLTKRELFVRLYIYYQKKLLNLPQVVQLFGSLDALGNPRDFLGGVSAGFHDLIFDPLKSGNVVQAGKGLIDGVGISVSKITNTLTFTYDDEFQERRKKISDENNKVIISNKEKEQEQQKQLQNKKKDSLVQGVVSGVTGFLDQSKEEIEKGRISTFAQGVGKGFVGLVSKPFSFSTPTLQEEEKS